ncbi:MAG TPA: hypothetical protein DIU37_05870, partial [Opitutae bacterium]|nr:hypothetical protein [Opitutae bacterium]
MKSFLFIVVAYLQCTLFVSAALYLNEEDVAQALERGKEHAAVCRVGDVSVFFDNFIDDEEDIVIAYDGEITGVLIHPKAVLTNAFYLKHNQIKSPLSVYFEDASGNRRRVGVKACHIHPLFSFFASKKKDFYINELVADFAILELEETLDERTFPPARLARNYAPLEAESHLYGVGYGDFASIEEGRAYSQHEQRRCFDMMTGNQCVEFFHAAMHFVTWEMLEDPKNRHRQIGLPLWGDSGAPIFNEAGEVVWMGCYAASFVDMMDEIENDKKESDVHDQDVVGFFTDIQVGLPWVDAVLAEINGLAAHQNIHSLFSIVEFVDNATLEYCVTLAFGEGDFGCAMGLLDMGVTLSPSSLRGDWTAEALKNACKQNNLEVIYRLHALGVDIDASPDGFSPLSTALFDGHYDAAAVLIELGADLDTRPWWLLSRG